MGDIVYVMTNEAMPGIIKIGYTDNIENRIKTLDRTSLPLPFECHYAARVANAFEIERILHTLFAEQRIRPNREFFRLSPEKVVTALRLTPHQDVTPRIGIFEDAEEQRAVTETRARRDRINLRAINVPVGAELVFSRDTDIKCTVLNETQIDYQGTVTSLSRSALNILQAKGYSIGSVSGSVFWMYEGETLDERRQRIESEQFESAP
ncbi:GIY-YIG nuclease family protein [Undibacterium amnicola]|uniref:GIY-YIG nuclease family protein n=1 Tax=Undibacterium amnicola TaxID=1834038 RepID=A0ABR6XQK4_9BURK|nr:GIY-YIG nuclease family protein [Undibacterium amnicola]MBC3831734.1 GIY-YIG nuclease family protein [Undibacterium amnicola]